MFEVSRILRWIAQRLTPLAVGIIAAFIALGVSVALASLTVSGTYIVGSSALSIDASGTIAIGTSTATAIMIGNPSATTTFPGPISIGTLNGLLYGTNGSVGGISTAQSLLPALGNSVNAASGISVLDSSGTIEASIYPTTYIFSLLFEGDLTGPRTFISVDSTDTEPLTKANGSDIYTDTAFRDPRLLKVGNTYFLSYTNNTSSASVDPSIGLAESKDMQNWTKISTPNWSSDFAGDEGDVWNGCWFYDASSSQYYLYFATADWASEATPYYVTFNPSANTFGTPTAVTLGSSRAYADIMAVWKSGGTYYALIQDNGTGGGHYVELATASSVSGTWTITGSNNFAGWGTNVESGAELTLPNGNTRVYFVTYGGGNVYYSDSSNLSAWTTPAAISQFSSDNVDWVDVDPFNDIQTDQVLNALERNAGTSTSTSQWTTSGSNIYYNTGNVGIGTSSPLYKLDVAGGAPGSIIHLNPLGADSGGYLQSGAADSMTISGGSVYTGNWVAKSTIASTLDQNNGILTFYSNSGLTVGSNFTLTPRFTITASGDVGVGTSTSPSAQLQVTSGATIRLGTPSTASTGCIELYDSVNSSTLEYIYTASGTLFATTTRPSFCQ